MRQNIWLVAVLAVLAAGCQQSNTEDTSAAAAGSHSEESMASEEAAGAETASMESMEPEGEEVTLPSGLTYQDLKVGDGATAMLGRPVSVSFAMPRARLFS